MGNKQKRPLGRPPYQVNHIPTDEVILQVSAKLFLERPYQDISMDEIAAAADVTKATVYYYFANKSELYAKSMDCMMGRIRMNIRAMISQRKSLKENLLDVTVSHLTATFHLDLDALLQSAKNVLLEKDWERMSLAIRLLEEEIAAVFQYAKERGEIADDFSVSFCSQAFLSLLKIGNKRDVKGNLIYESPKAAAEQIVRFFCKGVS
ncbi:TetR/AcrR family transcriptional regulator [Virgibacillus halophilus]|uniref:TetR/AcrR family transcriptional regulator n=1 Tax=Tigheibacillus halophilus TaxID=361280 RepID=A0ABU5C4X0_9BACI|nr:TetR/AcrR family transcriptional regulator [Virgibacillus halophilus]